MFRILLRLEYGMFTGLGWVFKVMYPRYVDALYGMVGIWDRSFSNRFVQFFGTKEVFPSYHTAQKVWYPSIFCPGYLEIFQHIPARYEQYSTHIPESILRSILDILWKNIYSYTTKYSEYNIFFKLLISF